MRKAHLNYSRRCTPRRGDKLHSSAGPIGPCNYATSHNSERLLPRGSIVRLWCGFRRDASLASCKRPRARVGCSLLLFRAEFFPRTRERRGRRAHVPRKRYPPFSSSADRRDACRGSWSLPEFPPHFLLAYPVASLSHEEQMPRGANRSVFRARIATCLSQQYTHCVLWILRSRHEIRFAVRVYWLVRIQF